MPFLSVVCIVSDRVRLGTNRRFAVREVVYNGQGRLGVQDGSKRKHLCCVVLSMCSANLEDTGATDWNINENSQ